MSITSVAPPDCKIRMDAASDLMALSAAHLKDIMLSGSDVEIQAAHTALRVARVRFMAAQTACQENCPPA